MAFSCDELIEPGGGGDWTTVAAFEGDHDGDSPGSGETCQGRIQGVPADTGTVFWTGWQSGQDSTTRIVMTANSGSECDGTDGSGNDAVVEDQWTLLEGTNELWMDIKLIDFNGVTLSLQHDGGGEVRIAKCMFRDQSGNAISIANVTADFQLYVGGCLFKDVATTNWKAAIHHNDPSVASQVKVFNCTICHSGGLADAGIYEGTDCDVQATNCAVAGSDRYDISAGVSETTNLCEDDGECDRNDASDWTAPSTDDYTIYDTNSEFYHVGTAIADSWFTTLCSTDFAGTSWASPNPSVGCFEYAAVGGRTTKNTDAWNHGQRHGMSFRIGI